MVSVAASVPTFTFQTPLVNTTTPGTTITHVPYDNVAPSVFSARIDPNARENSNAAATAGDAAETIPNLPKAPAPSAPRPAAAAASPAAIAAASFIAQLAAQDASPQARGLLLVYEKQLTFSEVKYKPSNAARPSVNPSSLFGHLLHSDPPAEAPTPPATLAAPPAAPPENTEAEAAAPSALPARAVTAYLAAASRLRDIETAT